MTDCEWTEQDTVLESTSKIHELLTLGKALYPALDILRMILAQTQNENCLTPNYACQKCPCLARRAKFIVGAWIPSVPFAPYISTGRSKLPRTFYVENLV